MHLVESFNMKIGSKFFNVVYRFFYYKEYFSCFPFFVVVFVKLRLRERLDIRTPPGWRGGVRREPNITLYHKVEGGCLEGVKFVSRDICTAPL